ncbi:MULTISPECIES: hypothetical protein [unclassified Haladaptatus]|uniref:DUF7268 family protein n=1 Tax=unclassified Haladaptatus TaxID=2622732 RepID=UPI0023E7AEE9|nr:MULTISPECIES: hypothetical protein [unclassified Haladaptatus]
MDLLAWLRPRIRLLGGAGLVGLAVGVVGTLAYGLWLGDATFAVNQVFALGALALGFATLGWTGSVFMGRSIETMQSYLSESSEWTEADSRRAMARIAGFGAGVMLGAVVASFV